MTSRRDVLGAGIALAAAAMVPLAALAEEVVLGEKTVGFNEKRDVIQVGRGDGRFTHLKITVSDSPIFLDRVVVYYGNGETAELPVRDRIRRGGETRFMALPGDNARLIRRIEIYYDRAAEGDKARITVIGKRD